jgi:hypothetical protein
MGSSSRLGAVNSKSPVSVASALGPIHTLNVPGSAFHSFCFVQKHRSSDDMTKVRVTDSPGFRVVL